MKAFASFCAKLVRVAAENAILVLAMAVGLLSFCLPGYAQLNLGGITGAITDQTGGAIVGATVKVIDVARGTSRPLVSDGAGEYAAPSLTPGTYTVHVEAMGFRTVDREDVTLQVGQTVRVDVTMQPGQQTQTITVTGDLPMIDTTSTQVDHTLDQLSIQELPANGRDYQYMLADRPGMVVARSQGFSGYSANGAASTSNGWMFEGLYDVNLWQGGSSIVGGANNGPDGMSMVPLDAIQEVTVVDIPKSEYGWKNGPHINVGLKSGTNSLHGQAFAVGRDTDLNARNPFLTSNEPKSPLAYEQFGASVGGPIKKDKLFYFGSYEGMRYSVGVPSLTHEPVYTDLTGTTGAVGNSIPDAVYDILHNTANTKGAIPSALSLNLAGCQSLVSGVGGVTMGNFTAAQVAALKAMTITQLVNGCSATAGILGGNQTSNTSVVTDFVGTGTANNEIEKIDWHPNDHNAFNGEVFVGGGPNLIPGFGTTGAIEPYWEGSLNTTARVGRAVWIWTPNSSLVNDFRFGYDREGLPTYNYECQHPGIGPNYTALGLIPGNWPCPGPSNPVFGGVPVTTISGFGQLGNTEGIFQDSTQHYFAFEDSVSYTHGKHVFKFGGELRFDFYEGFGATGGRGALSFGTTAPFTGATALEDFMAGVPSSGNIIIGSQYNSWYFNQYAGFAQDDWRILPRLTLNLGVRYEYTGSIWAVGHHMANFNPFAPGVGPGTANPTALFNQTPTQNLYKQSPLDFAPRIGLAYDITGKGTTVIRAGYSLVYNTILALPSTLLGAGGAYLQGIPSGFTFYNTNGSTFAGPGNVKGGVATYATTQLPWQVNVPIFNATNTASLLCGDGVATVNPVAGAPATEPAPCAIQAIDPNLGHQGQLYYQNLGIQHAFTNNLSVDINYVGTHGVHIMGKNNINAPTPGIPNSATNSFIEQDRTPYNTTYPFYSTIQYESPFVISNYNSLQASLHLRLTHGLNFTAGYTLAHSLDDSAVAINPNAPLNEYGNAAVDPRNSFTYSMTYLVPGRKAPAQLLEGWEVNTSVILQSGFNINASDSTNDLSGEGLGERWTLVGNTHDFKIGGPAPIPCWGIVGSSFSKNSNCTTVNTPTAGSVTGSGMPALCQSAAAAEVVNPSLPAGTANATGLQSLASFGCYMMGSSVMVAPAQGTFGTMARDALYYEGFHNWNLAVTKSWKFKERYGAQFRADFFNVLNRTAYSAPGSNLAAPSSFGESTSEPDISNPVIGNGVRKIQFGLKFLF